MIAPDLRGHGLTRSVYSSAGPSLGDADSNTDSSDLSLETLVEDAISLLVEIFARGLLGRGVRRQSNEEEKQDEGNITAHGVLGERGSMTEPLTAERRTAGAMPFASPKEAAKHSSERSELSGKGVPISGHIVEGGTGGSGVIDANGVYPPALFSSKGEAEARHRELSIFVLGACAPRTSSTFKYNTLPGFIYVVHSPSSCLIGGNGGYRSRLCTEPVGYWRRSLHHRMPQDPTGGSLVGRIYRGKDGRGGRRLQAEM